MFKKLDSILLQLGEAVIYLGIIMLVFLGSIALIFAIPIQIATELLRGDFITVIQLVMLDVVALYLTRGGLNLLKQIKLSSST